MYFDTLFSVLDINMKPGLVEVSSVLLDLSFGTKEDIEVNISDKLVCFGALMPFQDLIEASMHAGGHVLGLMDDVICNWLYDPSQTPASASLG